ncbi:MmcQ/YjbR family DNA-binding protein [Cecembia calidifontis]|uniref:MmcQ/YjbR family DNA-binding protein n=1 Tax=Cecembia calidifontis TaxID=1187080 RepID=UPI00102A1428
MFVFESGNLKCDPDRAIELRERHEGVLPGYHRSKNHWNAISCDGSVPDGLILQLVDHSFYLVFNSLTKKIQQSHIAG